MVIASDQTAARAYAELLIEDHRRGRADRRAVRRPRFLGPDQPVRRPGTSRWLVAVRMVSEGVDVPRLAVGVYATSASTPLFFAQAIGRFVRSRRPGETASIFLPSVPNLLLLASEMEAQRNHVLGKPHRETLEDPLDAELADQRRDEPDRQEKGIEYLGADAELDQVIFDGSSFGTATPAGSDEEADYLGIPGLLDAASMRDLLRRRQEEQLTKRTAAGTRGAAHHPRSTPRTAPRTQRSGVGDASPHRPVARLDPQRTAPGLRRPAGRRGQQRTDSGPHRGRPLATGLTARAGRRPSPARGWAASRTRRPPNGPGCPDGTLPVRTSTPVIPTTWAASTSLLRSSPTMIHLLGFDPEPGGGRLEAGRGGLADRDGLAPGGLLHPDQIHAGVDAQTLGGLPGGAAVHGDHRHTLRVIQS